MSDAVSPEADYLRGCQLLALRRFEDAEAAFRRVLAFQPAHAWALHQLAVVHWRQDRDAEALPIVRQAIGAEPEEPYHHILHCHVLCALHDAAAAREAAEEAVRLDPGLAEAFAARAEAASARGDWAASEEAARAALALDAENELAHHYLANALRKQGRKSENAAVVDEQLRRDPDSPLAHANAGWAALERGESRRAEAHFAEALRLSPDFEWAREGLLQAFRARSPVYRAYLAYTFWMERHSTGRQWAMMIGLYLAVRFSRTLLEGPYRWVALLLGIAYVAFAFWAWVARGVGNLMLLGDKFGRMVLRRHEKLEAVFVGGGLFIGLLTASAGFAIASDPLLVAGVLWAVAAIPLAATFDNTRRLGRWLFGTVGGAAWIVALLSLAAVALPGRAGAAVVAAVDATWLFALIGCVVCSWLGNIGALRRRN